jgi:predicted transcriptional regulator
MSRDDAGPAADTSPELPELRNLDDPRTLRALTHPVRIALIETLTIYGPMTATEAGERIGESPTTCSFHLRQLAKYGFVEEAGGGTGRRRPWKMTSIGFTMPNIQDDPAAAVAAAGFGQMIRERQLARYREWKHRQGAFPRKWRNAANDSEYVFYLTAEELHELNDRLFELLAPYVRERLTDPSQRPPGAVPVELMTLSYPLELPPAEDDDPES